MKKNKSSKKRIKEIEKVYQTLGLYSEEARKYYTYLGNYPNSSEQEKRATFISAGINSQEIGEINNAGLESVAQRSFGLALVADNPVAALSSGYCG